MLTTMGRKCVKDFAAGKRPHDFPSASELTARIEELDRTGFLFLPYKKLAFAYERNRKYFEDWDLENYGSTFILEPYIQQNWLASFDLVALYEAPDEWQDYVILKRRGPIV